MIRALVVALALALTGAGAEARPVVAILADPSGVETTDLTAPYAIMAASGAVDVRVVSPSLAPAPLMPGMAWVKPQETYASFARRYPAGPDMIIVPFLMDAANPERAAWLRAQAARGVRIVSICDGAMVLAQAGLLDGRAATAHWASLGARQRKFAKVKWRQDARWVTDGPITTTAGVSASVPASLAMLEELAGPAVMQDTARRLRLTPEGRLHDASVYRLNGEAVSTAAGAAVAFLGRQQVAVELKDGFDELAFGSVLDGWTRTYRAKAWAVAPAGGATSRGGLTILAAERLPRFSRKIPLPAGDPMDAMLGQVRAAYGPASARFVALQLEHPLWRAGR